MHIHIVAVSGSGMGSLAGLLKELGHEVSGSDVAFDPPMGPELESWGIRCMPGFDPAHLEPAPDLVVVGNVCRPDNPEARAALERGLPVTHIAGALARFALAKSSPLVVAGTHGKTTTTALAAWLLDRTGFEPDPSGQTRGSQFWGHSFACGPQGEVLASASTDQPEVLVVDLDLARSESVRRWWPFLRDRRIDAYGDLLKRFRD